MYNDIFIFFPNRIYKPLSQIIINEKDLLEEIRIRINKKIILKFSNKEIISEYITTDKDIIEILQAICEKSIYSYQKEIAEGYITIKGGHRIGITGNCVIENRTSYKYKLYI